MKIPTIPRRSVAALLLGGAVLAGCAVVPVQEFTAYREAFAQVVTATERILTEYDTARKAEAKARAAAPSGPAVARPFPSELSLTLSNPGATSRDPVAVRRQALSTVTKFNDVLALLAEGKSVEQVKSGMKTLVDGIESISELLTDAASAVPYAGQIIDIASKVVQKLDEANNREQFITAMRATEPLIRNMLALFAADAETVYKIRATQADRRWAGHQDQVATLVRQMRRVAAERKAPAGGLQAGLASVAADARKVLDRVGLTQNSAQMKTTGTDVFDALTLSQLQQTLKQASEEARRYEAVVDEQQALRAVIESYGALLGQAYASLVAVRAALDSPPDIRAQTRELIAFAFGLKRDFESLDEARRAAAGT